MCGNTRGSKPAARQDDADRDGRRYGADDREHAEAQPDRGRGALVRFSMHRDAGVMQSQRQAHEERDKQDEPPMTLSA